MYISSNIDNNKVFIVNRSEIEGRLDAEYYRPEILSLEQKVRAVSSKKLRNYIYRIASGATPSVKEEDLFYSDKENGIPFLRVQNLQPNGKISLEDVKYINQETHQNYLRRSQVGESDLLVKITGVGRMAIASVAPSGFVGNTNQHMVVIKTENKSVSDYLASYLNLDFVEKLASRRSTGGTRPALDYPALKSIPIIEGIDFSAIERAEIIKQQKEAKAKELLDGIDDYLLNELGVKITIKDNCLNNRMFTISSKKIWGKRFDASYSMFDFRLNSSLYDIVPFTKYIKINPRWDKKTLLEIQNEIIENCSFIPMDAINEKYGSLSKFADKNVQESNGYTPFIEGDILWAKITPCMQNGKSTIAKQLVNSIGFGSTEFHVFRVNQHILNNEYVLAILRLRVLLKNAMLYFGGAAGQQRVSTDFFNELEIPLPPIEKQVEIAKHIADIKAKAKALQQEAQDILERAKREVEQMILGE